VKVEKNADLMAIRQEPPNTTDAQGLSVASSCRSHPADFYLPIVFPGSLFWEDSRHQNLCIEY
jgi:hypothetical protein